MADASRTLRNLHLLQELIKREQSVDEVIEATVSKLLAYEVERLKEHQNRLREKLETLERRYGLPTEEFYRRFQEGRMGDEMDFFEWAALSEMYGDISKGLAEAEKADDGF